MTVRRLLLPVILGCTVLSFAAPASAMPPERFSFEQSGTELGFVDCGGFVINLQTTGIFNGATFFDQSGEEVKIIIRGRITETMTNSETGKTLVNRGVFQDFFRRIDGTDQFTHSVVGFDFQGKVAGRGPVVFQEVGRKVFGPDGETIVFSAGHSTLAEGGGAEAVFCAALS
jgi:hypothetical protein